MKTKLILSLFIIPYFYVMKYFMQTVLGSTSTLEIYLFPIWVVLAVILAVQPFYSFNKIKKNFLELTNTKCIKNYVTKTLSIIIFVLISLRSAQISYEHWVSGEYPSLAFELVFLVIFALYAVNTIRSHLIKEFMLGYQEGLMKSVDEISQTHELIEHNGKMYFVPKTRAKKLGEAVEKIEIK